MGKLTSGERITNLNVVLMDIDCAMKSHTADHLIEDGTIDDPTETLVKGLPAKMPLLTEGPATTIDRIELRWKALTNQTETGQYPILSYNLEMFNNKTGSWQEVVGQTSPYLALN